MTDIYDREWLVTTLEHAITSPHDLEPFVGEGLGYIDDVVAELAWSSPRKISTKWSSR